MVCKISNFNMWAAKYLAQASSWLYSMKGRLQCAKRILTTAHREHCMLLDLTISVLKKQYDILCVWVCDNWGHSTTTGTKFYLILLNDPYLNCDNSGTLYWNTSITFHAVVVYGLGFYFLFKRILLYCDRSMIKLLKHFLSFN